MKKAREEFAIPAYVPNFFPKKNPSRGWVDQIGGLERNRIGGQNTNDSNRSTTEISMAPWPTFNFENCQPAP
jgi:hypothetical protein